MPNHAGNTPAEDVEILFGEEAQQDDRYRGLVAGVKSTLAAAPAERAWLRRGWLVMTRSRIKRQRRQPPSSPPRQQAPSIGGGGDDGGAILSAREEEQGDGGGGAISDDITIRGTAGTGAEEDDYVAGETGGSSVSSFAKIFKRDGVDDVGEARIELSGGAERRGEGDMSSSGDRNGGGGGGAGVLSGMIDRVAGIQEEDIFHKIVLFL